MEAGPLEGKEGVQAGEVVTVGVVGGVEAGAAITAQVMVGEAVATVATRVRTGARTLTCSMDTVATPARHAMLAKKTARKREIRRPY